MLVIAVVVEIIRVCIAVGLGLIAPVSRFELGKLSECNFICQDCLASIHRYGVSRQASYACFHALRPTILAPLSEIWFTNKSIQMGLGFAKQSYRSRR